VRIKLKISLVGWTGEIDIILRSAAKFRRKTRRRRRGKDEL